eukprot:m.195035 g.195035  ORF g.195035 m.195035 type:complete len:646 (-) comp15455_c0_seq2:42-1979(-)
MSERRWVDVDLVHVCWMFPTTGNKVQIEADSELRKVLAPFSQQLLFFGEKKYCLLNPRSFLFALGDLRETHNHPPRGMAESQPQTFASSTAADPGDAPPQDLPDFDNAFAFDGLLSPSFGAFVQIGASAPPPTQATIALASTAVTVPATAQPLGPENTREGEAHAASPARETASRAVGEVEEGPQRENDVEQQQQQQEQQHEAQENTGNTENTARHDASPDFPGHHISHNHPFLCPYCGESLLYGSARQHACARCQASPIECRIGLNVSLLLSFLPSREEEEIPRLATFASIWTTLRFAAIQRPFLETQHIAEFTQSVFRVFTQIAVDADCEIRKRAAAVYGLLAFFTAQRPQLRQQIRITPDERRSLLDLLQLAKHHTVPPPARTEANAPRFDESAFEEKVASGARDLCHVLLILEQQRAFLIVLVPIPHAFLKPPPIVQTTKPPSSTLLAPASLAKLKEIEQIYHTAKEAVLQSCDRVGADALFAESLSASFVSLQAQLGLPTQRRAASPISQESLFDSDEEDPSNTLATPLHSTAATPTAATTGRASSRSRASTPRTRTPRSRVRAAAEASPAAALQAPQRPELDSDDDDLDTSVPQPSSETKRRRIASKCPTPGCDGSGNTNRGHISHKSVKTCPRARAQR